MEHLRVTFYTARDKIRRPRNRSNNAYDTSTYILLHTFPSFRPLAEFQLRQAYIYIYKKKEKYLLITGKKTVILVFTLPGDFFVGFFMRNTSLLCI